MRRTDEHARRHRERIERRKRRQRERELADHLEQIAARLVDLDAARQAPTWPNPRT